MLLIGAISQNGFVTSAERFPVNGSGVTPPVAGTVPGSNIYTSVLLANGDVPAATDSSSTAMRFVAATSRWIASAFSSTRFVPTMMKLADGGVLLAGREAATVA